MHAIREMWFVDCSCISSDNCDCLYIAERDYSTLKRPVVDHEQREQIVAVAWRNDYEQGSSL